MTFVQVKPERDLVVEVLVHLAGRDPAFKQWQLHMSMLLPVIGAIYV
jgi:hypothetical protein